MQLRRIRHSDLPALFDMRNDPAVYMWCRQNAPLHWQRHEEWYQWQAKDSATEMFVLCDDDDTGLIYGCCGLTSIDYVNRRAEFSLYIGKEYQGTGYGQQGLQKLFNFGFNFLGLNLIWGETFEGNPAARIFEKIGMEKEGVRRDFYWRDGRYIGATLYSLRATNFDPLRFASRQKQTISGRRKNTAGYIQEFTGEWINYNENHTPKDTGPDQA